ncbi:MAG: hypothetical protein KJ971_05030, partial [Firmicutes bacterium]|nr:hypothetical protein [Bacillota bacterium]
RTYLELDNTEENSQALYSITKQIEKSILETSGNEIDFPNLNIFPRLVKVSEDTLDSTSYDDKVIKIIEKMNYDDYMGDNYKDYYSDLEAEDNDIDELFQYYNPKM